MLLANTGKAVRERLILIRLFEELQCLGYAAVRRYARNWSRITPAGPSRPYVPLSFVPEESYQFDGSHAIVAVNVCREHVKCPASVASDLSGEFDPLEGRMRRTEQLQGLRMLKLRETLTRWEARRLSQLEAAEILGMSGRTFRRRARRFESDGDTGRTDRRLGLRAGHAVPCEWEKEVARLYRGRYKGLTAKHFHEYLTRDHGFRRSYSWTKIFLRNEGLIEKAPRRGAHRRKRDRRSMAGMVPHQDASKHPWLPGLGDLDLAVTMDDATSEICSAIRVEEEGTMSSFPGLAETIAAKGLFSSFCTDRGSDHFSPPEAGGKVSKGS